MTNVNPITNIRYGVISGNSVPSLMENIFENGTDLSYEGWKKAILGEIKELLNDNDVEALKDFIEENSAEDDGRAASFLEELDGEPATNEDAIAVFDDLQLNENYQNDEPSYSYEDGEGNQFEMSYLGGAPIIYCLKTSNIVKVNSLCSPCVPNAGDLDSGLVEDGYECYGVPA